MRVGKVIAALAWSARLATGGCSDSSDSGATIAPATPR